MSEKYGVGVVGVGRRGYDLSECLVRLREDIDLEIRGLCNRTVVRAERARDKLTAHYGLSTGQPEIRVYRDFESLIDDPLIDLVMICTPQYAHKDPALYALKRGKSVCVDKPLAHTLEDAREIYRAATDAQREIIMSFTRRFEQPWIDTYEMVTEEDVIGPLRMIQVRNIIPYHTYFHTWHRRMEWSGGAIADKLSHIFDAFNWFAQDRPLKLSAFGGQSVFAPDPNAPERCRLCRRECPYRVAQPLRPDDAGVAESAGGRTGNRPDEMADQDETRLLESEVIKRHDTCVWFPGADINDHGVITIEYDHGVKASLFWSLFGPDSDDQETMELVGDRGRIILTRHRGTIDIVTDYGKTHRVLDKRSAGFSYTHFGADDRFIVELDRFAKGRPPRVSAREGLLASRMVEAAHRSIRSGGELVWMKEVQEQ